MSPRAAWRLETLGFEHTYDYVAGKADWLAHGLPREGANAEVPYTVDLLDREPPTCRLHDDLATAASTVQSSRYDFCLVVNDERILLGRLRRSVLEAAVDGAAVEDLMEPGPSTIRPGEPARALVDRLASRDLNTAIVTTPEGRLLGVFSRREAEHSLQNG
jgi:CBS domain-containing protein